MLKKKFTYTQIIALSFLAIIFIGALLLSLPVSSLGGEWTNFIDCLFTATSATCVTGLVVYNTSLYWSELGQLIILLMIQIGGLGLMTLITLFLTASKKRTISLHERLLLQQSARNSSLSGVVRLIRSMCILTFLIEFIGAALLFIDFVKKMSIGKAMWLSVFHSVSAFCNAGFDLMGQFGQSSFMGYAGNYYVSLILMLLIIFGGLGFFVWTELIHIKFKINKASLHAKVVLAVTVSLILIGWVLFFFMEKNSSMGDLSTGERIIASLFMSVTPRTAGFNSIDYAKVSEGGSLLTMILMLIGGSPGSTAGGIKTTTIAVLIISTISCARTEDSTVIGKKRIDKEIVRQASAIVTFYLFLVIVAVIAICSFENFGLKEVLFEVCSGIGTVGLTMGITPKLCVLSKIILIALMYIGRLGGLSLVMIIAEKKKKVPIERPIGNILIG